MWINPETLEASEEPLDGYETVLPTQPPLTGRLEKAVPGTPELIDGMWYETWVLEPLTAAEAAQVIEAERVNAGNQLAAAREIWKDQRAAAVEAIKVEVDGMVFQGDETSQTRMSRSLSVMNDTETIRWVLEDNTHAQVTKAQLVEALRLAGLEQARLWVAE